MRKLPEQERKGVDIRTVLEVDERAAQAKAAAAATTPIATIAALVRLTSRHLRHPLGRKITQCAPHGGLALHVSIPRVAQAEARQTKVGELAHRVVRIEQCIISLDVVVQDAVRVEEAQPARQLHGEANLVVARDEQRLRCDRR